MPAQTIFAERTLRLPRRSIWNPARRLLGRPIPSYVSHLFADAVVYTAPGDTAAPARLSIDEVPGGVDLRLTVPHDFQGMVTRISLRERGADKPMSRFSQTLDRLPDPKAAEEPQTWPPEPEGLPPLEWKLDPPAPDGGPREGGLPSFALKDILRVPILTADQLDLLNEPGHHVTPTESTTVMADLAYIADVLETAQFQVAMSPGGAAEGSPRNEAHAALCAVQLVQAKLAVVADAAELASLDAVDAMNRVERIPKGRVSGAYHSVKRVRDMLRTVTACLPRQTLESAPHVRF